LLERTENTLVTMIESGPPVDSGDRRAWLDFVARGMTYDPHEQFLEQQDDQENVGAKILGLRGSRYFGVGGTTNTWGGWCIRYQPEDFYLRSNTGHGADWPFDLETLRPFYERAEETLWVAGAGKPNAPIPFTQKDGVIIETLKRLRLSYEHLPLARRESCATIGTCKYCPIEKRYLPQPDLRLLTTKFSARFALRHSTKAVRLVMNSKRQCVGVAVRSPDSVVPEIVESDVVVLALGAIETPKLLLASKENHPNGIGNGTGHVGRHITAHPLVRIVGQRADNKDCLEQPLDFPTLASRHFDTERYQPRGKLFFVNDSRTSVPKIEERLRAGEPLVAIRDSMRSSMTFELRGFVEVFSDENNYIGLGSPANDGGFRTSVKFSRSPTTIAAIKWAETELRKILDASGLRGIESKTSDTIRADHATSTCRMSTDECDGVVDPDLRVHGTDNLFVCSNAVLPNGAAVNPTLTLIALAEKLAEHLAVV
jgi:choline dehydrogenase-like flavoprotein